MDVTSLEDDETHDMEVRLDNDAGRLRLLITVSDIRPTAKSTLPRPSHHQSAAVDKYTVTV